MDKAGQLVAKRPSPPVVTARMEEILKTIHFYRFMSALDITHLLYSPGSLTTVRALLSQLSGNADHKTNQYLYRFRLPSAGPGVREGVYTLGAKGREYLSRELGIPVSWYFRPQKVRQLGYAHLLHNLTLTRFLVAASVWARSNPSVSLTQTRISYDLAKTVVPVRFGAEEVPVLVVPDAWLLFEQLQRGRGGYSFPVLLEIDRGSAYREKFTKHLLSRIGFVESGAYQNLFGKQAVLIAYAVIGTTPAGAAARRASLCAWTQTALSEFGLSEWAQILRFHSLSLPDLLTGRLFEEPVWYRPDRKSPGTLFALE